MLLDLNKQKKDHLLYCINQLEENSTVFESILKTNNIELTTWKQTEDKWNMLEIICHLYDEELEDFRVRINSILSNPTVPFTDIDPDGWVKERAYNQQNYEMKMQQFIQERKISIDFLKRQENANWGNEYHHPNFGAISANFMLTNWIAHDYLHIRQLVKLKYDYLAFISKEKQSYAGIW